MKTKKLKNHVKKAIAVLTWPVQETAQESGQLRIFSDATTRTHTIYLPPQPADDGAVRELLYLHELGHALLCERVHPFFSSAFPISGLEMALLPAVSPLLSAASDWFVGQWMMEFCPEVAMAELKKEYEATAEMMAKGETPSLEKFFVAVLITAQSIRYLKAPVECSGFLDAAVKALLAIPPDNPSPQKLEELINGLLTLGAPYRCRRIITQGQDVLEFYLVSEGVMTAHDADAPV
jgi:hypothetical protein